MTGPERRTAIHDRVERARAGTLPGVITRLPCGWAVMGEAQFLPGYALLLPDPVVPTLNDLHGEARRQFLMDMARLGDAILACASPRPLRINYEMLGNLEPALHAHCFPRYDHEPPELRTKPVWSYSAEVWTDPSTAFDPARAAPLVSMLRQHLGNSG